MYCLPLGDLVGLELRPSLPLNAQPKSAPKRAMGRLLGRLLLWSFFSPVCLLNSYLRKPQDVNTSMGRLIAWSVGFSLHNLRIILFRVPSGLD